MIINFDPKRMNVQIICGSLETYKPNENIQEIQRLVDELKEKMIKFQEEIVKPSLDMIQERVNAENKRSQSTE